MIKSRMQPRNRSHFERHEPTKEPKKSFLIVTEGKETEPNYFRALCKRLELKTAAVEVIIDPAGIDPKSMIVRAIEAKVQREEVSKKSGYLLPYDEAWVVFDWENTHNPQGDKAREAIGMS